jgi:tellurite resistance protein TehA-like permease
VQKLPPNIFAIVMATGIVSLAAHGAGYRHLAHGLFWLNVALYAVLSVLLLDRALRHRADLAADLQSHAKAPGFFTLVAAPCVLGNQCVVLYGAALAGQALWVVGTVFWLALSYVMVPGLMEGTEKPMSEEGLNGAWLLPVVGTQAVSVLACRLVPAFAVDETEARLFLALVFWLFGSMLYVWQITLIFHRILFLPLSPRELTPSYWINMGAMAISTLAGVCLAVGARNRHRGQPALVAQVCPAGAAGAGAARWEVTGGPPELAGHNPQPGRHPTAGFRGHGGPAAVQGRGPGAIPRHGGGGPGG